MKNVFKHDAHPLLQREEKRVDVDDTEGGHLDVETAEKWKSVKMVTMMSMNTAIRS